MTTAHDIDTRLLATRDALHAALDRGDLDAADILTEELDDLLDQRTHTTQQR